MNTFGEFLYKLRKEKGMTQAELAEKLGVTNKAVSKWETGEAMPETSLLLPIAEIFGVTVDELLNGRRSQTEEVHENGTGAEDSIKEHLFTRGKDEPETALDKICGAVCAAVMLCGICAYVILGAVTGIWSPYWLILTTCALGCGIIGSIFNLCDRVKREQLKAKCKNPYTGGVCGIIMLSCIISYLFCGALASLWHPCWVIIVAGAAACGIIGAVGDGVYYKRHNGKGKTNN